MSPPIIQARRQLLQSIKSIRKTYYEEWKTADDARKRARESVLALQSQQRAARIQKRAAELQVWLKKHQARQTESNRLKERIAAETWNKTAANIEIQRSKRAKAMLAPLKGSLANLIDSSNLDDRITAQLIQQRSKLRGLPEIDICHQDGLLLKYLCDPLDPNLAQFQKEYLSEPLTDFSANFTKPNNNSSATAK